MRREGQWRARLALDDRPRGSGTEWFEGRSRVEQNNRPVGVIRLGQGSGGEGEDGIRRRGLRCAKMVSIQFEEQDPDNESRPLVGIDKGMVLDDAGGVGAGHEPRIIGR